MACWTELCSFSKLSRLMTTKATICALLTVTNHLQKLFKHCFADPTFFAGRCAEVVALGSPIGMIGVVHPAVLENFELQMPCAALEINIEKFL